MIRQESELIVADNSGAKIVQCIRILKKTGNSSAEIGDIIVAAVKSAMPHGKVHKSDVVKCVIVRTKKELKRKNGSYVRFDDNAVVIINDNKEMIGTRVFGPVSLELREREYLRIISLATELV